MTATWCSMFKLLSKIRPMWLVEWEGIITEPSTDVKERSWETGQCCDPVTKSSVLLVLSLSLFKDIHLATSYEHASILGENRTRVVPKINLKVICIGLKVHIMSSYNFTERRQYKRCKIQPRMEPRGTLYIRSDLVELIPFTQPNWLQPAR